MAKRGIALLSVVVVLAGACSRSDSPKPAAQASSSSSAAVDRLAQGGFGDLTDVCGKGEANGATARGVTDTEIHVGTVTDKGNTITNGLNKEMADAAVAFTTWCNQQGGILGRKLVLDDLDAQLFKYNDVITKACTDDFALVGGGAVFDDADNGQREQCDLPSIAGFVTTPKARTAKLLVQPVPNPVDKLPVGQYKAMAALVPDGLAHYGVLTGNIPTTQVAAKQYSEGIELLGGKVVYSREFDVVGGESNWAPFVDEIKSSGVKVFELIGSPAFLQQIQSAMATANFYPDAIIENTNMYDSKYAEEGGKNAKNTYIRSSFFPLELKDENAATADYLSLLSKYNPSGKVAQLGVQATSAWLLFAQAAKACGSKLTNDCLLDQAKVTKWTGGGLHAETNPSTNTPSSCFLLMTLDSTKFVYDEKDTKPNSGKYNCDDSNIVTLSKSVPQ